MMHYRDGTIETLWVPGLIVVDGVVRVGPDVGWLPFRDIDDWKREAIFVEKRALAARTEEFPEPRIDAARLPNVRDRGIRRRLRAPHAPGAPRAVH